MIMQQALIHNVQAQEKDSPKMIQYKTPPFSRFTKSFPTSAENQGSTYIKIVSPTVFKQKDKNTNGYCGLRGTNVKLKLSTNLVVKNSEIMVVRKKLVTLYFFLYFRLRLRLYSSFITSYISIKNVIHQICLCFKVRMLLNRI